MSRPGGRHRAADGRSATTARPRRAPGRARRLGEHRATVGVAALSAGLGAVVVTGAEAAHRIVELGVRTGSSATVAAILPVVAWVFIGIALYVSAVVASNTCATVIAGRTRALGLQRVLGATGQQLRWQVTRTGAACGVVGAALGTVVGTVVADAGLAVAAASGTLPPLGVLVPPSLAPIGLLVAGITTVAFRIGSRAVLTISPLRALEAGVEAPAGATRSIGRTLTAGSLVLLGTAGLGGAVVLGATSVDSLLLAVACGALSFTGVVVAAPVLLPAVLRLAAAASARSVVPAMAARNALRAPRRTARATVGLLIAVTLMATFSVGFSTYAVMLQGQAADDPEYYRGIEEQFDQLAVMFTGLVGAAGVIAAAGVVVVTALTIAQRGRELGLLRVVGATRQQVRALVLAETTITVAVAVVLGGLLGTAYGWAGASTLLGATKGAELIAPVVPAWLVVVVVVGAAGTGLAAALGPAARAVRAAPVTALRYE
ncbi:ABC transporter permease [Curtobacterium sp. RHCJP20]|uniref:ABC transporter permease n=1 Tax=Curtobacterium subtropicum TaxID=3055138 RepID=A0ABT7TD67_9MICO|nr:ABC transporter permease [Curtobacterium subtropicum]MDM7887510.1 ABC transporter permease [Curtobacterium subtropicum]